MSQDWADKTAQKLLSQNLIGQGACLILGGADTGKTALTAAIAKNAASTQPVGIIDADIGQSHIGPPTTVGWAIVNQPQVVFSQLVLGGISFVGDITPVGHLLQLTAAIVQCFQQVSAHTRLIIIDTPGFIDGPAAALWWTVERILQPQLILAVQHKDELCDIIAGLNSATHKIEKIKCPPQISAKSPQERRRFRQDQFSKYFRDSRLYDICLSSVAVQRNRYISANSFINRLVALRDAKGVDTAIGQIKDWQYDKDIAVIRAPEIDLRQIRCLAIGDIVIEIDNE